MDRFTNGVVEIYEANKTRERFIVGVLGNEHLQKVLRDCGVPYWELTWLGCTILRGDYDGVLIDCGNHEMKKALYCPKVKTYLTAKYIWERVCCTDVIDLERRLQKL